MPLRGGRLRQRTIVAAAVVVLVIGLTGSFNLIGGRDAATSDIEVKRVQMGIYTHPYSDATVARITVHNAGASPASATVTARMHIQNATYEQSESVSLQPGENDTLAMFVVGRSEMTSREVRAQYERNWVGEILVDGDLRKTLEPGDDRCQHLCPEGR